MRLVETSDNIWLFLENLKICCSEHVGIRIFLDPFKYLWSGHVANVFASSNPILFAHSGCVTFVVILKARNPPRLNPG